MEKSGFRTVKSSRPHGGYVGSSERKPNAIPERTVVYRWSRMVRDLSGLATGQRSRAGNWIHSVPTPRIGRSWWGRRVWLPSLRREMVRYGLEWRLPGTEQDCSNSQMAHGSRLLRDTSTAALWRSPHYC